MKRAITILSVMTALVLCGCNKDDKPIEDEPVKGPRVQMHDGHECVDLGLSVKWATMNVGADTITAYGDYFAWGETEPYYSSLNPLTWKTGKSSGYAWGSYKHCNGKECTMTKYCTTTLCGAVDNRTTLESGDDVASVNWGGDWRTPTYSELKELYNSGQCTWKWYASGNTEFGGVAGWKITSKVTGYKGNFIFLPNAGTAFIKENSNIGTDGYYMSSSLSHDNGSYKANNYAHILFMSDHSYVMRFAERCTGVSVRPVFK